MVINTLCAVCAGFLLDIMFGGFDVDTVITGFADRLEKYLRKIYKNSPEALRMAGGIAVGICVIVFAVVPAVLIGLAYKIPILGLAVDSFFCWIAFSAKSVRGTVYRLVRYVRSGNDNGTRRVISERNGDCPALEGEDCAKKAVEYTADSTKECVSVLFWAGVGGGVGAMLCKTAVVLARRFNTARSEYKSFGKPAKKFGELLESLPSVLAVFFMMCDVKFLKLDYDNCKRIYRRDRSKCRSKSSGKIRAVLAGALNISLLPEEHKGKVRRIGESFRECTSTEVYWSGQLMYAAVFAMLVLIAVTRVILALIF